MDAAQGLLRLKVRSLFPVAVGTQELEVLGAGRATEGDRDHVVILEVEGAAAFGALASIALEHGPSHLPRDGITSAARPCRFALIDVEQHVCPV
jgi:hypothetical protein